jgi:hypothetical protein
MVVSAMLAIAVGRQPARGAPSAQCRAPGLLVAPQMAVIHVCQVLSSSRCGWVAHNDSADLRHAREGVPEERDPDGLAKGQPGSGDAGPLAGGAGDVVGCRAPDRDFRQQLSRDAQPGANQVPRFWKAGPDFKCQPADVPRGVVRERRGCAEIAVPRAGLPTVVQCVEKCLCPAGWPAAVMWPAMISGPAAAGLACVPSAGTAASKNAAR